MKKHLIIIAIAIFATSCRTLVTDEFDEFPNTLTVNCIPKTGNEFRVHVSRTDEINNQSLAIVENAIVELFADSIFVEQLIYEEDGLYISNSVAEPNTTYHLKVSVSDDEIVQSIQELPHLPELLNVKHISSAGVDADGLIYPAMEVTFRTNPNELEYFEIILSTVHDLTRRDQGIEIRQAWLEKIEDKVLLNEGLPMALFSNAIIEDSVYTMHLNYGVSGYSGSGEGPLIPDLNPIFVELRKVTKEYYDYRKQRYLYEQNKFPEFSVTPPSSFKLYSNVENGFGIFAGYSSVVSDTIVPERL